MTSGPVHQQVLQIQQPQKAAPQQLFKFFPKLADELKLMIWKEAANLPRYVDLWTLPTFLHHHPTDPCRGWRYRSLTRVPGVLHACTMSRTEALKHYVLFRDDWNCTHQHRYYARPMIYINWSVDILCPTQIWAGWYADLAIPRILFDYPQLRKIAVNCTEYRDWIDQLPQQATDIMFYIVSPPLDTTDFDFYRAIGNFSLDLVDLIPNENERRLQSLLEWTKDSLLLARWEDWPFRGDEFYPENFHGDAEKFRMEWCKANPPPNIAFKHVIINGDELHART